MQEDNPCTHSEVGVVFSLEGGTNYKKNHDHHCKYLALYLLLIRHDFKHILLLMNVYLTIT